MENLHYHINIFWSEEDACYIADVPDLEYCSAHGNTPEKALQEIQIAISAWVETARETGRPIPEAKYKPAIYA